MDIIINKSRYIKKKKLFLSLIILVIILIYFVFFIGGKNTFKISKDHVKISVVGYGNFEDYIEVTGTVEPTKTVYLDIIEGGRVTEKYVQEGAELKKGMQIIKIDNPNLSLQLMSTQSNFMVAESQLRQTMLTFEQNRLSKQNQLLDIQKRLRISKKQYEIDSRLFEKNMIPSITYEQSKEDYNYLKGSYDLMYAVLLTDSLTNLQLIEQSKANVKQSRNYLLLVKEQLNNLTIRAPYDGLLTALNVEVGQSVNNGYRLGRIDNLDHFKIKAEVDEHYLQRLYPGLTGTSNIDDKIFSLKVSRVYPQINNGRFFIDVDLPNSYPQNIKRGQTIYMRLYLGGSNKSILLDNGTFYQSTFGKWVYILDESGKLAIKRNIKLGRHNPKYYEVLEGLKSNDKVITSSYETFKDADVLELE